MIIYHLSDSLNDLGDLFVRQLFSAFKICYDAVNYLHVLVDVCVIDHVRAVEHKVYEPSQPVITACGNEQLYLAFSPAYISAGNTRDKSCSDVP